MFKEYFDKIDILTLAENKKRQELMHKQFKNLNCEDEIYWQVSTFQPFCNVIINGFNTSGYGKFSKPNEFNCSREHYTMIKRAYEDGYNSILLLEDDLRLLKNKEKLKEYFENIPKDWNILRMSVITNNPEIKTICSNSDNLWLKHNNVPVWSTAMYALNRKGMKYYLLCQEKFFQVADMPLFLSYRNTKIINSYISKIPLGIQESTKVLKSDIREGDHYDGMFENEYEKNINRKDYFSF